MKVKYVGFKLFSKSERFNTAAFFSHLHDISGFRSEGVASDRYFFFNNEHLDGYLLGLVVTLKDQKRFCRAEVEGGDFRLKTEDLLDDEKLVDFNFFALRKDTNKGIFQYYHNSCSPNVFGDVCKKIFYRKKESLIHERFGETSPDEEFSEDSQNFRKAKKYYSGRPHFTILVDNRNIEDIIRSFSEVKELEVSFEAPDAPTQSAVAAPGLAETISLRYKFELTRQVQDIAEFARNMIDRRGFRRGRAKTVNEFDEERIINLIRCPHDFGQEDFDDLAQRINNLKASEFVDNTVVSDLVDILESRQNARVFAEVEENG